MANAECFESNTVSMQIKPITIHTIQNGRAKSLSIGSVVTYIKVHEKSFDNIET